MWAEGPGVSAGCPRPPSQQAAASLGQQHWPWKALRSKGGVVARPFVGQGAGHLFLSFQALLSTPGGSSQVTLGPEGSSLNWGKLRLTQEPFLGSGSRAPAVEPEFEWGWGVSEARALHLWLWSGRRGAGRLRLTAREPRFTLHSLDFLLFCFQSWVGFFYLYFILLTFDCASNAWTCSVFKNVVRLTRANSPQIPAPPPRPTSP